MLNVSATVGIHESEPAPTKLSVDVPITLPCAASDEAVAFNSVLSTRVVLTLMTFGIDSAVKAASIALKLATFCPCRYVTNWVEAASDGSTNSSPIAVVLVPLL